MQVKNKIIELQLHHCIKQHLLTIEFYEKKLKRLNNLKKIDLDNEPSTLFKNKHKKWELEIESYDREIEETNILLIEETKSLEETMNILKN